MYMISQLVAVRYCKIYLKRDFRSTLILCKNKNKSLKNKYNVGTVVFNVHVWRLIVNVQYPYVIKNMIEFYTAF